MLSRNGGSCGMLHFFTAIFIVSCCTCITAAATTAYATLSVICPRKPHSLPYYVTGTVPNQCDSITGCVLNISVGPNTDNHSFIDFHIEARAGGYGAVGFSQNKIMPLTDVMGCGHSGDGTLYVRNTWNNDYVNRDDPSQDGMCVHSIEYEDGMIKCSFSRYAGIINTGHDFDLNDSYHLILAYRNDPQSAIDHFSLHTVNPVVTSDLFNVYTENGSVNTVPASEGGLSHRLIVAHGVLMVIGWPLLGIIGIFFSTWTRPFLSRGRWFKVHRILMICSVVVSVVGVILVFIANKDNRIPGLIELTSCNLKVSHLIIGVLLTVLQLLNPVIAIIRCKPQSQYHYVFTIIHGVCVGHITELLALVNVGIGISLLLTNCDSVLSSNNYILLIYIIWSVFFICFQVGLLITFSLSSFHNLNISLAPTILKPLVNYFIDQKKASTSEESNELLSLSDTEQPKQFEKTNNLKDKDNLCRCISLVIFTTVTILITVIIIISIIGTA